MDTGGWVKLHRKIRDNCFYHRSAYVHLWVHLLLEANHDPKEFFWNGEMLSIGAGQLITGRTQLSEDTGIPSSTIEDILNSLEKQQQIRQQKTTKFRIISIVNWSAYQSSDNKSDNKATTKQQQSDTNKKYKKEKKEKYYPSDSPEYRLAALLFNCIVKRDHNFKANLHAWAAHIDELLRIDKRQPVDVVNTILWCQKDPWWQNNIINGKKLREKFPQLYLKMEAGTNGQGGRRRELVL